jgi:hypothetical protein
MFDDDVPSRWYGNAAAISLRVQLGQVAQLVEQRTENPRVGGSIPSLAIQCKPLERQSYTQASNPSNICPSSEIARKTPQKNSPNWWRTEYESYCTPSDYASSLERKNQARAIIRE